MTWPAHRLLLLAIFGLGLSLRLSHYWAIADTPFPDLPLLLNQTDLFANVEWARTILGGDWLGRSTYHPYFSWMRERGTAEAWYRWWGSQTILQQAPLYPYWVAGWFALLGESLKSVLLIQLVLGALDCIVIYGLARRLFDVRVGLLAAAMTALYGPFIFQQGTLLRDWLPPILEPLALLAIVRARDTDSFRDWLLAGCAIGLALLAKETLLLFLPLLALWLVIQYGYGWRKTCYAVAGLVLGATVVLSPVFIRNGIVGAPLFSLSNRAAEGFIEGNAPDAEPLGFKVPDSLAGILERANGQLANVVYETLLLYKGDWLAYVKLLAFKLRAIADPFEIPNNLDYVYAREISPVLSLTIGYGLIFPIGVAGILLSLKCMRTHGLLVLYGVSIIVGLLSAIVLGRYRLALVPVLIIYGAVTLVHLFDAVRQRKWNTAAIGVVMITALAIIQSVILPIPKLRTDLGTAHHYLEYFHSSKLYGERKEFERAAAELVRMRQRAAAVPDTPENQEPKVVTISAALEREGYVRMLAAIDLFEHGKREQGLQMAEVAKNAYFDFYRTLFGYVKKPVDAQLEADLGNTPLFFARLQVIRAQNRSEGDAIRTLTEWLERQPERAERRGS